MGERPDGLDRRDAILLRVVPYGALVVSTILVLIGDAKTPVQVWTTLGLTATAAVWLLIVALPGASTPRPWPAV
ncbi:hypothetical protein GCM10029978_042340 [Actinoallomurus acanthiterrae]